MISAGATGAAWANPRPLPFTYQTETLPAGSAEVEQFVDLVPTRAQDAVTGESVRYIGTQFQTEIEYGITDKLEVALYLTFVPSPGPTVSPNTLPVLSLGNGAAQRLRYRLADPGAWPIDVALYGEITENEREIELEAKILLQRRVGAWRFMANLWGEREFYFDGKREWVLNPTLGATVELSPRFHVGAESWMRSEYLDSGGGPRAFNLGPHVFVGPAFMANLGKLWWTAGVYGRVTDAERATQPGDAFGRLWIRTIVGFSL